MSKRVPDRKPRTFQPAASQQSPALDTRPFAPPSRSQPASAAPIQTKLTVTPAGDQYEQEADRVAGEVVAQLHADASHSHGPAHAHEEEPEQDADRDAIQRQPLVQRHVTAVGGEVAPDTARAIEAERGSGAPLDPAVRSQMEGAFNHSFSNVRVHADAGADRVSRALSAEAFATGSDLFFRRGAYDPTSRPGQELLAHELTHVVQQGASPALAQRSLVQRHEPAEVASARDDVATAISVDPAELVEFVQVGAGNIEALGSKVWQEVDWATLVKRYAIDMALRRGEAESEGPKYEKQADDDIKGNQGRGFADMNGQIWMLKGVYAKSDLIHEFIHLLSGAGGVTKIYSDISGSLNEGFTQYFAEEVCRKTGGSVAAAYPEETAFVQALGAAHGLTALYDAYFRGNTSGLLDKLTTKYEAYCTAGKLKDGKTVPFSEKVTPAKPWDPGVRKAEVLNKLKDFKTASNLAWLMNRVI